MSAALASSGPVSLPAPVESRAPRARAISTLRRWIQEGVLPPGQPLPTEDELARRVGVSRGTLRSALAMLDEEGLLRSNGGRLRIVQGPASAQRASTIMEHTVAVLTGHAETPRHKGSGWLEFLTSGALDAIRGAGWHGLALHPARLQGAEVSRVLADPPAGAVVTDLPINEMGALLAQLQKAGTRVVTYGEWPDFDRVTSDHEAGAYAVTRFLIERGRRRILQTAVAPGTGYWYAGRRAGYERAMREAELELLPMLTVPSFPLGDETVFADGARHFAGYLVEHLTGANPVDAIMASTDADVFGLAAACRVFGLVPNRDVWISGYDNYWAEWPAREFEPIAPVVTVDKNNLALGAAMVELVLERIEGQLPPQPQRRVVAPRLVEV